MNKWFLSRSRRERATLLIGVIIVLVGVVIVPMAKRSAQVRSAQMDELDQINILAGDYQSLVDAEADIVIDNATLFSLVGASDGFLFERTGNNVMMEAMMTKLLNQFGPDLSLNISEGRSSLRNSTGRINYTVQGSGRYSAILNLIHQIETHRPIIAIDDLSVSVRAERSSNRRSTGRTRQTSQTQEAETTEPTLRLQMSIHINCMSSENES
jgi:hypothetical protein